MLGTLKRFNPTSLRLLPLADRDSYTKARGLCATPVIKIFFRVLKVKRSAAPFAPAPCAPHCCLIVISHRSSSVQAFCLFFLNDLCQSIRRHPSDPLKMRLWCTFVIFRSLSSIAHSAVQCETSMRSFFEISRDTATDSEDICIAQALSGHLF
jgi:hypothetical protein